MSKYHGYGRFIIYRSDDEGYRQYDLLHSEITQFGHTIPYRTKKIELCFKDKIAIEEDKTSKLEQPHSWLDGYVADCMPYDLEEMLDGYDFKMEVGEFAEICGFLEVEDTSTESPEYGKEYDSQLNLEEPQFTVFKLEDLKDSYYYTAWAVAEWLELRDGLAEGETTEDVYKRLVKEGYSPTAEDIEAQQEASEREYYRVMGMKFPEDDEE